MTSDPGAGHTASDGTPATPASVDPAVEWTASDRRGPLATPDALPTDPVQPVAAHTPDAPATATPVTTDVDPALPPATTETPQIEETAREPIIATAPEEPAARAADDIPPTGPAAAPRRSVWPLAAALVAGAAIGAGSAIFVQSPTGASLIGQPAASGAPAVADLSNRVDALEKRPDAAAAVSGLRGALADLDSKVAALRKTTEAEKAPAVDLKPLDQKIAALEADLASLKSQASAAQGDRSGIDSKLAALQQSVEDARRTSTATQSDLSGLKQQQTALAGAALAPALAVVADSLVRQVQEGAPYAVQVDALTSLGADPARISVLREHAATGVAPARALATDFDSLATPLAASAHQAPPNASVAEKLKAGMFSLVTIRRVDETGGTDLSARVSRLQSDLARGDVVGAYGTWSALPDAAKAKSAAFGAKVKASAEAILAARALQHDSIVGLAKKS